VSALTLHARKALALLAEQREPVSVSVVRAALGQHTETCFGILLDLQRAGLVDLRGGEEHGWILTEQARWCVAAARQLGPAGPR
jgi:DNA-binding IscR family transcriptional regulator